MKVSIKKPAVRHKLIELGPDTIKDLSIEQLGALVKLIAIKDKRVEDFSSAEYYRPGFRKAYDELNKLGYLSLNGEQLVVSTSLKKKEPNEYYDKFLEYLNNRLKKKYKGDNASRGAFNKRIIEGYVLNDFIEALDKASEDKFHKENRYNYLTPEYILRDRSLQRYLNLTPEPVQGAGFKMKING